MILATRSSGKSLNCRRLLIGIKMLAAPYLYSGFNHGDGVEDRFERAAQIQSTGYSRPTLDAHVLKRQTRSEKHADINRSAALVRRRLNSRWEKPNEQGERTFIRMAQALRISPQ